MAVISATCQNLFVLQPPRRLLQPRAAEAGTARRRGCESDGVHTLRKDIIIFNTIRTITRSIGTDEKCMRVEFNRMW